MLGRELRALSRMLTRACDCHTPLRHCVTLVETEAGETSLSSSLSLWMPAEVGREGTQCLYIVGGGAGLRARGGGWRGGVLRCDG